MNSVGRTTHAVLALWNALAALQNIFDLLAGAGIAPSLRPLASKNLALIAKLVQPLRLGRSTQLSLLGGAAATEALAAGSFARGALSGVPSDAGFVLSLALFGTFFIIDDAFDDYDLGAKHRAVFALLAASYAASKAAEA